MKTQAKFLSLLILAFLIQMGGCRQYREEVAVEGRLILLDAENVPEPHWGIDSVIDLYRQDLEEEMNQVVAYSAMPMRRGTPEGLLNNFVADLVFQIGQDLYQPDDGQAIDFCLLNYGGLRTSIPEGAVTRSRVFELMPFENEMVVITLSPQKTMELFEYLAASSVGMPVAGITLGISNQQPSAVSIQGSEFDNTRNYRVLTSDYLALGGDNMTFFLDPVDWELLGMKIREAILLHMEQQHQAGRMIKSQLDGRIYIQE